MSIKLKKHFEKIFEMFFIAYKKIFAEKYGNIMMFLP